MTTFNAAPNTRRLPRWGHIDVEGNRVTEFNPVTWRHEVIYQQN